MAKAWTRSLRNSVPWSEMISLGTPNHVITSCNLGAIVCASAESRVKASGHLVRCSMQVRIYRLPVEVIGNGPMISIPQRLKAPVGTIGCNGT